MSVLLFCGPNVCVYICACVAESFWQIHSATTVPPLVESPPGWHCGWLATRCVSGRERERAREHYFHLAHTSSCSPHTPVTLTLPFCPLFVASMEGTSLTFSLFSLFLYLLLLHDPSNDTSKWALSFLVDSVQILRLLCCEDRKRFLSMHRKFCCSQA